MKNFAEKYTSKLPSDEEADKWGNKQKSRPGPFFNLSILCLRNGIGTKTWWCALEIEITDDKYEATRTSATLGANHPGG